MRRYTLRTPLKVSVLLLVVFVGEGGGLCIGSSAFVPVLCSSHDSACRRNSGRLRGGWGAAQGLVAEERGASQRARCKGRIKRLEKKEQEGESGGGDEGRKASSN